jgi:Helicase HerA, central domain
VIDVPAGHLFLGEHLDPETRKRNGEPVLLEAADLTTHGVIVGMTGSGKTRLSVVLIEEVLLAGIPTLVIDPKGDLGNPLLTFPELKPEDFAPWVESGDPAEVATQWSEGLASWGIEPSRIAQLRDAAEFTIYRVSLLYDDDKLDLRKIEEWEAVLFPLAATVGPAASIAVDHDDRDLRTGVPSGATYVLSDAPLDRKTFFTGVEMALVDHLYRTRTMRVMRNAELGSSYVRARRPRSSPPGARRPPTRAPIGIRWRCRPNTRLGSPKRGRPWGRRGTGWPRPRRRRTAAASPTWSRAPAVCSVPCSADDVAPAPWPAT